MNPNPPGQPVLLSLQPDDPDHGALTALAVAQAREAVGKDLELDAESVDRCGHWAFVSGRLRDAGGSSLSLEDTRFAEAAAAGGVSDLAVVLFRQEGDPDDSTWTVVDQAILPSGVAWLGWPQEHGAPSQLLGIGG